MSLKIILFSWYSYFSQLLQLLLQLMPPPMRTIAYKFLFGAFGHNNRIDYDCYFRYPWRIEIGSNVAINRGTKFYPPIRVNGIKIILGNNIAIGPQVTFLAAGHDYRYLSLPDTAASIIVGDHVWIGGNSTILPGVTIGEGAVIAAGSVVVSDVPSYTIVAGVPALPKKKRIWAK
jgi:acetyltransferase-like isoleucine patch superfamily enzyme